MFVPAITSVVFLLWLADWRPYQALAVGVVPMLVIAVVAKVVARLRR
jgi:hypothetical protein